MNTASDRTFVLHGTPNPKQREFLLAQAKYIAYGGARGGGKSWALRRKLILLCLRYKGLRCLLLRRTYGELRENHIYPLLAEVAEIVNYKASERMFTFGNGSRIIMGYCAAEQDVYQYQGHEYDVIAIDEATHFTEQQVLFISTCNRSVRADFSPRMYFTCNPGGVGHAWVKRRFIDKKFENAECAEDHIFIPAKVYDNHVLMQNNPEYIQVLKNLPDDQRKAFLDGDWNAFAGQYFKEFRTSVHVVEPHKIPEWYRRYISIDWGYNDHCCVLWHAIDDEGRVTTYRELYVRETLATDVARQVKELTGEEQLFDGVASPDMWQKRGVTMYSADGRLLGENIADAFLANGINIRQADNARVVGWQRVREYMRLQADGLPKWQVTSNCENLIRTLPLMVYSQRNPEDIADGLEDHAPESLRYGLMARPIEAQAPAKPKLPTYDPLADDEQSSGGFLNA